MAEIDLLKNYPKVKRDLKQRFKQKTRKTRLIARKFGKEFFDGDRKYGYGGYFYHSRFWQPVVPDFKSNYHLTSDSSILDVGCGKGFMLYDFMQLIPGIQVTGIDISDYAIANALPEVKPYLMVANAKRLPFPDKSFDLVISINTIHNLPLKVCKTALAEIQRVTKKNAFITVDAYKDADGKKQIQMWNLTAKTILDVDEWVKVFNDIGFTGDYYWFIP